MDIKFKFKKWISQYKRIMQITKKPDKDEILSSSKICLLGLLLIGFIGFIIFLIFVLLKI